MSMRTAMILPFGDLPCEGWIQEEEEEEGEREGVLDVVVDASGRMVCETGSREYCINVSLSCPESCPNPMLVFKRSVA